jgi:rhodanese-related sulfurtransferase
MDIDKISPDEVKECVPLIEGGKVYLIDVRTKEEWDIGHAPKAIHFDLARLENGEIPDVPKDADICACCATGARSEMAKNILIARGFTKVRNLGGLRDWKIAGGPVVN